MLTRASLSPLIVPLDCSRMKSTNPSSKPCFLSNRIHLRPTLARTMILRFRLIDTKTIASTSIFQVSDRSITASNIVFDPRRVSFPILHSTLSTKLSANRCFLHAVSVFHRFEHRSPHTLNIVVETPENFKYGAGEHEHTAGYDATCTAICLTKLMAFIGSISTTTVV